MSENLQRVKTFKNKGINKKMINPSNFRKSYEICEEF